jgi:glyoxylase-like metal-dependent hydrolase (beta-lactamase superfamily II)
MKLRFKTLAVVLWAVMGGLCSQAADARDEAPPPDWFHVFAIDKDTYAISEPKYWQQNVSYLILGTKRALLFDTGPGLYDIKKTVGSITHLPLVVIPSHLHFDHVGDLHEFTDVRLLDTPAVRARFHDGYFSETTAQYMLRTPERFRVHGWVSDGQKLDLGHRQVTILSTPGHTPDSITILDEPDRHRLFTGDLINRLVTLCDVPGSDIKAMAGSLARLIKVAPPDSVAFEAHAEVPLQAAELKQLAAGVPLVANGTAPSVSTCLGGLPMRRYDVGVFAILLPPQGGAVMKPLGSATETLDWLASACPGT